MKLALALAAIFGVVVVLHHVLVAALNAQTAVILALTY